MNKKKQNVYVRLLAYLFHYKIRMILAIIFIFIAVLAMALGPYFVGLAINTIGDIFSHGITNELKYYL